MLQQTQVERVIPHWHAWLERFPTVRDLAAASRADVIRAWQGLGYNLRAVRLHELARQVVAEHGGQLPRTLDGLLGLRGVGRYTAGAVACFAYEQPVAMVDTNIRRALGRVFLGEAAVGRTSAAELQHLADAVLPAGSAYAWNQALMDLGATLCRARRPACQHCPLVGTCRAAPRLRVSEAREPTRVRETPAAYRTAAAQRLFRGRIVDVLRQLPRNTSLAVSELGRMLQPTEPAALERLIGKLADDGLVVRDADGRVRLPD